MDLTHLVQSRYYTAADLAGKTFKANIETVNTEELGGKEKAVLGLANHDRQLVVNPTNLRALFKAFGQESGNWLGRWIEVTTAPVTYRGQRTRGIVITPLAREISGPAVDEDVPF